MKSLKFTVLFGVLFSINLYAQTKAGNKLSRAAIERTTYFIIYDGSWFQLDYPGGDVPDSVGVCTQTVCVCV